MIAFIICLRSGQSQNEAAAQCIRHHCDTLGKVRPQMIRVWEEHS